MKPPQVSSFYSIPALRKLALRACLVNAKLDPVGKGKSIVGKGVGTVLEKLAWVHLAGLKRLMAACVNCTPTPHLELKLGEKKILLSILFLKHLALSIIFQKDTYIG